MTRSVPIIEVLVNDTTILINKYLYLGALDDYDITSSICFDYYLWNDGYIDKSTTPPTMIIPPVKNTVITLLQNIINFINKELANKSIKDYGFKTQLERFLVTLNDLKNKIEYIQFSDICVNPVLVGQLSSTLVITLLQLITLLEVLNGLLTYLDTCGCIGSKSFELLMGKFVNTITELQYLMQDWYGIVMTFFQYSAAPSKSYVASYMPKQPIPPPPIPAPIGHVCVPCPPKPPQFCSSQYGTNNCIPYPPHC